VIICEIIVHLLVTVQNKNMFLNTTYICALKEYRVIRNDCWGFNNLSYTINLR